MLGLFAGKQVGVFASVGLATMTGLARRPAHASWGQVYGVSVLCGIGFTMSLFIGGLAFPDPATLDLVRVGVLGGSVVAALGGYLVLRFSKAKPAPEAI